MVAADRRTALPEKIGVEGGVRCAFEPPALVHLTSSFSASWAVERTRARDPTLDARRLQPR